MKVAESFCVGASQTGKFCSHSASEGSSSPSKLADQYTLSHLYLFPFSITVHLCFLLTFPFETDPVLQQTCGWGRRSVFEDEGGVHQSRTGFPFTLYRDLACLSKWLIKMSYYQSLVCLVWFILNVPLTFLIIKIISICHKSQKQMKKWRNEEMKRLGLCCWGEALGDRKQEVAGQRRVCCPHDSDLDKWQKVEDWDNVLYQLFINPRYCMFFYNVCCNTLLFAALRKWCCAMILLHSFPLRKYFCGSWLNHRLVNQADQEKLPLLRPAVFATLVAWLPVYFYNIALQLNLK